MHPEGYKMRWLLLLLLTGSVSGALVWRFGSSLSETPPAPGSVVPVSIEPRERSTVPTKQRIPVRSGTAGTINAPGSGLRVQVLGDHAGAKIVVAAGEAEPDVFTRVDGHLVPASRSPERYRVALGSSLSARAEMNVDDRGRAVVPCAGGVSVFRAVAAGRASPTVVVRDARDVTEVVKLELAPIVERAIRVVDAVDGAAVHADVALYDPIADDVDAAELPLLARLVSMHGHRVLVPCLAGAGSTELVVAAPGYITKSLREFEAVGGQSEELVVALDRGTAVHGIVTDPGGTPVAGAEVAAMHRSMFRRRYTGVTDASGRYRIGVPPGHVDLTVDEVAHEIAHREDVAVDGVPQDFVLVPTRVAMVAGIVTDDEGKPLPRATVELWFDGRSGRLGLRDDLRQTRPARTTRTNLAGRFALMGVRFGAYDLDVIPDGSVVPAGNAHVIPVQHRLRDAVQVGEDSSLDSMTLALPSCGHLLVSIAEDVRRKCGEAAAPGRVPHLLLGRAESRDEVTSVAQAPCVRSVPICFAWVPVGDAFVLRTIPASQTELASVEVGQVRTVSLGGEDEVRIRGVLFRDGHAITGATITALSPSGNGELARAMTDVGGRFELTSACAGATLFHARDAEGQESVWMRWLPCSAGLVLDWPRAVVAVEAASESVRAVTLELGELDGVDVAGLPVATRRVWHAQIDVDRRAELRAVPPGLYRVLYRDSDDRLRYAQQLRVVGTGRNEVTVGG